MKRIILIAGLLATSTLTAHADRLPICRPSMNTTECIQTSPTDGRFCDRFEPGNLRLPEGDCGHDKKRADSIKADFGKAKTRGGGDDSVDPPDDADDDDDDGSDDNDNGGGNDDNDGCKGKGGGNCGVGNGGGGGNGTGNEGHGHGHDKPGNNDNVENE